MTWSTRPFLWFFIAAALFTRAVLPQGYMPERSDRGSIAVVVCGSGGTHLIRLDSGEDRPEKQQRAEPPCAFAGLGAAAPPPSAATATAAPFQPPLAFAEPRAPAGAAALAHLRPPATGPPRAA